MKARLISTGGQIILDDDIEYNDSHEGHYSPTLHRTVWDYEYSIINDVDWSSFRRETAKDILANVAGQLVHDPTTIAIDEFDPEFYAKVAVEWADVLIAKLKEK